MKIIFILLFLFSIITTACAGKVVPFHLSNPVENFKLPKELLEISGIDFYKKNKIISIQDEDGKIYVYNIDKKELKSVHQFAKKGDYESVAVENENIWVLKSDGSLFLIKNFSSDDFEVQKITTELKKANDTEGLAYDPEGNRLLIACKGSGYINEVGDLDKKNIYSFDLKTQKLDLKPVYSISLNEIKNYFSSKDLPKSKNKKLSHVYSNEKEFGFFQPSELRIEPVSKNLYVLASVGKMLVVLDHISGEIKKIILLDKSLMKQPEGMTFTPDGDLLISDEGGKDGKANVYRFKREK